MCSKERTFTPEKYGQKPRVQKEVVFNEKTKSKMLCKVLLGDNPGGRLGRTVNFSSGNVHRRRNIFHLLPSKSPQKKNNPKQKTPQAPPNKKPYSLQRSPL